MCTHVINSYILAQREHVSHRKANGFDTERPTFFCLLNRLYFFMYFKLIIPNLSGGIILCMHGRNYVLLRI